ncbi:MAG TPA: hypothetical protein VIV40_41735 [Kofleriaceae bacterium]
MARFALALIVIAGCATVDYDEPQDADEADGKADGVTQSCATVRCGNPSALQILFPGNLACPGGCERNLASDEVYIPPRNGKPWGDTYELGELPATTLAGYSSGRIALLRRLALVGDGVHAVMLDPSWDDGARNFLGSGPIRGDAIVKQWLLADPARTFVLIYSTRSIGWASYAALRTSEVGAQVKVCSVGAPHLLVPKVAGLASALVDPDGWDNGTCRWGY